MKNTSIKILGLAFAIIIVIANVNSAAAEVKPATYYSGDAISYNGHVVAGSANRGGLELFKLENGQLKQFSKLNSFEAVYSGGEDFKDLVFAKNGTKLYVYAAAGQYLYKYDISDLTTAKLVSKISDGAYDWFLMNAKIGGKVATGGSKGVKIWNAADQVINTFTFTDKDYLNVSSNKTGSLIFTMRNHKLEVFNVEKRDIISRINVKSKWDMTKQIVNDPKTNSLYIVDDEALKLVDLTGKVLKTYKHNSNIGYDVLESGDGKNLYFSDGMGVVKIGKDMKPVAWAYTTTMGGKEGWAANIRLTTDGKSENIVVFNSSNILVLDSNLKKIASYLADKKFLNVENVKSLSLKADKTRGAANTNVSIIGKGFTANEKVTIKLLTSNFSAKADKGGNFSAIITVPADAQKSRADIIATGETSKLSYSLGFEIE